MVLLFPAGGVLEGWHFNTGNGGTDNITGAGVDYQSSYECYAKKLTGVCPHPAAPASPPTTCVCPPFACMSKDASLTRNTLRPAVRTLTIRARTTAFCCTSA